MRAVRVHEFGDPDVLLLEEVPQPEPVEGEVLVRVQAAGVNPVRDLRAGGRLHRAARPPLHPRRRRRRRARRHRRARVRHRLAQRHLRRVRPVPRGGRAAAAGRPLVRAGRRLGVPYFTAYRALFQRAAARAGRARARSTAPAAAWASPTVQLALAAGLDVTGTAGSEAGSELVAAQGDVRVLDHRDPAHLDAALELTGGRGLRPHHRVPRQREPRRRPQGARAARPRGGRRQPRHAWRSTPATS